ncbi:MAG: hypothetical protein JXA15_11260 [Spirochaetales bacterium]|nr:hypothetical protein [Spirochaetales bacterium]
MNDRARPRIRGAVFAATLILTFAGSVQALHAEADPIWVRFEEGRKLYEAGRFGDALTTFRNAADERRRTFEEAQASLAYSLKDPLSVRALGSIDALIRLYADRDFIASERLAIETAAGQSRRRLAELFLERRLSDSFRAFLSVLDLVLRHRSWDELHDSISRLDAETRWLARYPEAEYWIGRVYQREGEIALARAQFERALSMGESFETTEDRYAAAYALAETWHLSGDMASYEASLKAILREDPLMAPEEEFLIAAMERTLSDASGPKAGSDAFDRFMTLYRTKTAWSQRAWRELAAFYRAGAREQALVHAAVAVNAPLTRIIERIAIREPGYVYTTLEELAGRILADRDFAAYAEASGVWQSMLYLADSMWLRNNRGGARSVWTVLARYPELGESSRAARAQLSAPSVTPFPSIPGATGR